MAKTDNLKDYLKDLHEGIKTKKPDASRNPQDFRREIESIETGVSLDPLTNPATAEQILFKREVYDSNGEVVTGTMVDNRTLNLTINGLEEDSVDIPKGYTEGGVVSLHTNIQEEVVTQENLIDEIINIVDNKMVSPQDMLQARVDATNSCECLFYRYTGDNVDFISGLDTSNVTNMYQMFYNCSKLTTILLLNTSNVTSMQQMFYSCSKLTTIPLLNTNNVINMNGMLNSCYELTTMPLLNTSKVTDMSSMFYNCNSLTTIPQLDTSKVTNMSYMFYGCKSLTTIPLLNTSNVTNMSNMFNDCTALTTIPELDTSKVTDIGYMFNKCANLTTIPQLNTSNVTNMRQMFYNCNSLTTIPQLDTSKTTNMSSMFGGCTSLKSILMTGMKVNFDISASTQFERTDLVTILNNLATVTTTTTLTMGATNLAKLTDEDKAIATNKGWTLK